MMKNEERLWSSSIKIALICVLKFLWTKKMSMGHGNDVMFMLLCILCAMQCHHVATYVTALMTTGGNPLGLSLAHHTHDLAIALMHCLLCTPIFPRSCAHIKNGDGRGR
jgi:hypothetical protein